MVEYHSTATVLLALQRALEDDPDQLDWLGVEIGAIHREIERARVKLGELLVSRPRKRQRWWRCGLRHDSF